MGLTQTRNRERASLDNAVRTGDAESAVISHLSDLHSQNQHEHASHGQSVWMKETVREHFRLHFIL